MILEYMNKDKISSRIFVDFKNNKVSVENFTDDNILRAFGVIEEPTMEDLEYFLEDRCFPVTRDHLKDILRQLGLDCYDPLEIIAKTQGRMAEDDCWVRIVEE